MKINNTEFEMYSYYLIDTGVVLTLQNTSFEDIIEASGNDVLLNINGEYIEQYMHLSSIKRINDKMQVTFINPAVVNKIDSAIAQVNEFSELVRQNTDDIEANAAAIVELAEIIGGME